MKKLALVYGLRLLPEDEIDSIGSAEIVLKSGKKTHVTMHLMEGDNEEEIRRQLNRSLEAYFEFYPEV
ncbi:MAG: allantoinase [Bryobacteraceae bacterium]